LTFVRPISAVRSVLCLIDDQSRFVVALGITAIAACESGTLFATWILLKLVLGATLTSEQLQHPGRLGLVLGAILAAMTVRTFVVTALWSLIARRLARVQQVRAGELFSAYIHLPYLELLSASRSQMMERLRHVSRTLMQGALLPVLFFLADALVAVSIVAVLLLLAPGPTVLVAVWLVFIFSLIHRYVTVPIGALAPRRWQAFRNLAEFDEWSLQHAPSVHLRHEEHVLVARQRDLAGEAARLTAQLTVAQMLPRYISELALLSSTVVLFGWFAWRGDTSAAVLRELAVFTLAGLRLLPAGQRCLSMMNSLQQDTPVTEGIIADLAAHRIPADRAGGPRAPGSIFVQAISLHGVAFSYPGGRTVIPPGTTLSLQRGEWLHILGPSGSGKSTLVALLLGLLRPDLGHISFDGKPADPFQYLRGPGISIVMQDTRFLRGSVAENLAFPRPPEHLDHTLALELMQEVGLDFALDTSLGQDGAQLSGGQRQRLAIVKALLNQPELLVLDEATAQLDHDFERTVFEVIRQRLPEATVIVIAHKPGNGMGFDRIWERRQHSWHETRA